MPLFGTVRVYLAKNYSFMLSKSRIVRGSQCHKSLWLYKNNRELQTIDDTQKAIFQSGTEVGLLARMLFPGGIDPTENMEYPSRESALKTQNLIDQGIEVIYEATFIHNDVLVAVDILVKTSSGWDIYEVKSSTKLKEVHVLDGAIQSWVLRQAGLTISNVYITLINSDYTREEALKVDELFYHSEINSKIGSHLDSLPSTADQLKIVLQSSACPAIDIGPHCKKPYECDFKNHCWKDIPDNSVLHLTRGGAKSWNLYRQDVKLLENIPDNIPLTLDQEVQVRAEQDSKKRIQKDEIKGFLDGLSNPLYCLDFETYSTSVPLLIPSHPYQQIPFQYSIHKQLVNTAWDHLEYLSDHSGSQDPRIEFIEHMLQDLGQEGSILVYHESFEKSRIQELARDFPEYAQELEALLPRVVDLETPFKKKHFYVKEMKGRSSIKNVLPALVPQMSYDTLDIQNGSMASLTYLKLSSDPNLPNSQALRQQLLDYCKLDTLAMVKLLEVLFATSEEV